MRTFCCVCGKERVKGKWVNVHILKKDQGVVSHGYCPKCYQLEMDKIKKMKEKK